MFSEVTGESLNVQLTLKIDGSDTGTVRYNDQAAQPYSSGIAKITVAEGKVRIVVEPNEKTVQRYDDSFQVSGETTKDIKLAPIPTTTKPDNGTNTPPPNTDNTTAPCTTPGCQDRHEYGGTVSDTNHPGSAWRKAFVASTIGTVASIGVATLAYEELSPTGKYPNSFYKYGVDCNMASRKSDCNGAGNYETASYISWAGIGVFGAIAVVALYEGYIKHDSPQSGEHADNGHRKRRERFVVTPVVGPTGGGAQVQLNW
jgi:hypothetical protein